ncbi:hypothetical protein PR202_ga04469 [Eleusine coracana subsp. coracana]|uniref:Uncharacterized protein n=1 Tax=Eleusine coracana subsp. coracana TaxID=191504 RepID=A0AAV5BPP9_ELECO|nr:hypothetical protein PR202_ga04469 [Eleusine coracana subsp. coracana]
MATQRRLGGVQMSMNTSAMTTATSSPSRLNPASSSDSWLQQTLPMATPDCKQRAPPPPSPGKSEMGGRWLEASEMGCFLATGMRALSLNLLVMRILGFEGLSWSRSC